MKHRYLPLLTLLFLSLPALAQHIPLPLVNKLHGTTTRVGVSGETAEQAHMIRLLEENWTFTPLFKAEPARLARTKAQTSELWSVLYLDIVTYTGDAGVQLPSNGQVGTATRNGGIGEQIRLTLSLGGEASGAVYIDLPLSADRTLRAADLLYGIINLNDRLERRFAHQKQSKKIEREVMDVRAQAARGKVLYACRDLVDDELITAELIRRDLGLELRLVSADELSEVIWSRQKGAVYHVMPLMETSARSLPSHQLVDAETGFIFASIQYHLPPQQAGPPRQDLVHTQFDLDVLKKFKRLMK